jgi:hypothetical protein
MKSGINYGVLFTVGGVAFIVIVGEIVLWYSRRAEAKGASSGPDTTERLERAEAAIRRANEELASVRADLAVTQAPR